MDCEIAARINELEAIKWLNMPPSTANYVLERLAVLYEQSAGCGCVWCTQRRRGYSRKQVRLYLRRLHVALELARLRPITRIFETL